MQQALKTGDTWMNINILPTYGCYVVIQTIGYTENGELTKPKLKCNRVTSKR